MKLKVAVIGPPDLVRLVVEVGRQYPGLNLIPVTYRLAAEALRLALDYQTHVDVFLFAGPIPYEIASQQVKSVPMVYIPFTGAGLYRVLFQLTRALPLRISIDILKRHEVEERINEVGLQAEQLYVKEFRLGQQAADIVQFHYDLWLSHRIDQAITCVTSVYERLVELGVPCYRIIPTQSAICESLKLVQLEGKSLEVGNTQLAVCILNIRQADSETVLAQESKVDQGITQMLANFGAKTQTLMYWSDQETTTFITTRGVIEELTGNFTRSPLMEKIADSLPLCISQGIGIGCTANEAERNAKEALTKAEMQVGGGCYAVLPNRAILGPLGKGTQLEYSSRSADPELLAVAKQAGISIGTFNKLVALNEQHGHSNLTTTELAQWFGFSLRSARRLLNQLEQSNLAVVVGEEQPIYKGRPRQLYSLRLSKQGGPLKGGNTDHVRYSHQERANH
jgi:hypothetical protein